MSDEGRAGPPGDQRRVELAGNLAAVQRRLADACRAGGRDPGEVTLIVVTKTYPAADVLRLVSLGVTDVGENRDQEAAPKADEVGAAAVRWHFIGQLQRNKCRSVVQYARMVHTVDSVRLAAALDRAATDQERTVDALVQVSLDGDHQRGGALDGGGQAGPNGPAENQEDVALDRVLEAVAQAAGLTLRGLMAVAPLNWGPERAFATLAAIAGRVREHYPDADVLSAGMSGDVEQAIRHGATHVRMGSAVLGNRESLR